jgi:dynein heavy chain
LHKIIAAIYDFKYANFGVDILAKYIDESGTLTMRSQKMSGVTQNTKTNRSKKDKG